MLLKLKQQFEATERIYPRREAILKVQAEESSHFSNIENSFKVKYNLENTDIEELMEAQHSKLINETKTRFLHKKLIEGLSHELIFIKDSSIWLHKGNNLAKHEGKLCFLQDRNVFFTESVMCPHCNSNRKTVDYMATKCEKC